MYKQPTRDMILVESHSTSEGCQP